MRKLMLLVVAASALTADAARGGESVTVPLELWKERHDRLDALEKSSARAAGEHEVVIGETLYRGRSDGRNLRLTLELRAELAHSSAYKTVDVLGSDAVILSARSGKEAIALVQRGRRWVWQTNKSGAAMLEVDFVIPPRGPRGSIEYAFEVVRSPVTELEAHFSGADLSPRVAEAVTNQINADNGGVLLKAVLSPTERINIVGFHDIDTERGTPKIYGQTSTLVSLGDDYVDLFSVIDLAILYAPVRRFQVELPQGYDLVSADGEGAFQYAVDNSGPKPVLVGETAVGIKQHYQISLRLHRSLAEGEVELAVPRLREAERDTGFVAVEIPGKLSIDALDARDMVGIDVRELPAQILRSSVSPIVRAFRYAGTANPALIRLARHPEKALAAGGVDVLHAESVITEDGRVMTDLRFTIRNSLQQYLALELEAGAEVKSAVIDADPIKPSLADAQGQNPRVLVPLRRSKRGPSGLLPLHVRLVYEARIPALGAAGSRALALPKIASPVSSLEWSVYVPHTYEASRLTSDVAPDVFLKNARWQRGPVALGDEVEEAPSIAEESGGLENEAAASEMPAGDRASGAMPVRVDIPRDGHQLRHRRFWVSAGEVVRADLYYAVTPLPLFAKALAVLLAIGVALLVAVRRRGRMVETARAMAKRLRETAAHGRRELVGAWAVIRERRKASPVAAFLVPSARVLWVGAKLAVLFIVSMVLLAQIIRLVALLQNPL